MLDDRSLTLIIRDARNNGKLAMKILRDHYVGNSKSKIISLYTELTSLNKLTHENVTDYMLRGEITASSLNAVGENISDSLLMILL